MLPFGVALLLLSQCYLSLSLGFSLFFGCSTLFLLAVLVPQVTHMLRHALFDILLLFFLCLERTFKQVELTSLACSPTQFQVQRLIVTARTLLVPRRA